jgi:hypothetical protein
MASHVLGNLRSTLLLTALLVGAAISAQPAAAQDAAAAPPPPPAASTTVEPGSLKDTTVQTRKQMVSVFTGFQLNRFISYGFPFMMAGRYYFPIVPNGFLPSVNDEFGIEGGLDLLFLFGDKTYFGFGVPVDAVWDFHFSEKFDAYGKLGFVFGSTFSYSGFWFDFRPAVGLRLKLNEALYFRAEAGYPVIMAGLGFAF